MFEFILKKLLKYNQVKYLNKIIEWFPNWFFNQQNKENLWHYACLYQSIELIYYANLHKINIDQFNFRGLTPIHCLIENSFFKTNLYDI